MESQTRGAVNGRGRGAPTRTARPRSSVTRRHPPTCPMVMAPTALATSFASPRMMVMTKKSQDQTIESWQAGFESRQAGRRSSSPRWSPQSSHSTSPSPSSMSTRISTSRDFLKPGRHLPAMSPLRSRRRQQADRCRWPNSVCAQGGQ